ncbi:Haloacid dehalogenase-like hydrolase superfamily protein [Prunus dulcis]|uniref:Haloacid dehalogenase-like hydrolase superfamily protein n=1 Tax=Prunus dulcis TaxID=3755 RepID=A0A5H2XR67_PRUDU|nr:Haloacid dehalogenase-like hydrolase superfamily protein [Prunus dulcis]
MKEKDEDKEQNKRSNASRNNDTDHDIRAGLPCKVLIDVKADENNNENSLSEVSKLDPMNIQDISDIEQTETKTEVPSLPPLAVKADVDVAVNVKEGNLSQISDRAAERSLVSCCKKKLFILDIKGLLADIVPQECHIPKRYKPDITISRKAERGHGDGFSLGQQKPSEQLEDLFSRNQSHCTATRFNTIDNTDKPLVLKELRKLWEKHDPNHPWGRRDASLGETPSRVEAKFLFYLSSRLAREEDQNWMIPVQAIFRFKLSRE